MESKAGHCHLTAEPVRWDDLCLVLLLVQITRSAKLPLAHGNPGLEDLSGRSLRPSAFARRWITGSHEGGLSFDLCCKLSGRSPAMVRRETPH